MSLALPQGAKGPGSEGSREREGKGANRPGSESSRERIGQGSIGRFAAGSELARERKGCESGFLQAKVQTKPAITEQSTWTKYDKAILLSEVYQTHFHHIYLKSKELQFPTHLKFEKQIITIYFLSK